MQQARELRIGATIFYASLSVSFICCVLLIWQESRGLTVLSLSLILAAALCAVLVRRYVSSNQLAGWLVAFATLNIVLVVPELALRVVGYRGEAGIQFG